MLHIRTKHELIEEIVASTKDTSLAARLHKHGADLLGRFTGGWILKLRAPVGGNHTVYHAPLLGVRVVGVPPRLVVGWLRSICESEYVGGEHPVDAGEFPEYFKTRKDESC